ncbi:phosphatidylinositol N-acetylglucosaminyltransferase subunit P [Cylas formicarius]|uniref:phosphatidylinositol N-acetylglucosaminyltransferase subunit P n=1 Tax=Cylas formicarius TaxID=197179 RepID=UPI0029589A53|nr:phosphatidylinositol N-acetylglucosaminyltransferase subunit P [Cylas formicarius]
MPEHTPAPTPSRAVYGFAMFLGFKIFFIIYIIWSVIPEKYFEKVGIDFLPQRYWAIAVPIYVLSTLTLFAFVIYPSFGLIMTPDVDDIRTIMDKVGKKRKNNEIKLEEYQSPSCVCKNHEKCAKEYFDVKEMNSKQKRIPVLRDLDMWTVSESLYLN